MTDARKVHGIRRLLKTVAVLASFALFALGSAWLSFVHLPSLRLRFVGAALAERSQATVRRGFRFLLRHLERFHDASFSIDTQALAALRGPYVLVANHPSLIDVVLLTAAHERLVSIVKGEYYKLALLRPLLNQCDYIDSGDRSPSAVDRMIDQSVERLKQGCPILLFPEGTRSPSGELLPFRRAAFEIAARAGVPIVPAVIRVDPPVLTHESVWYRPPPSHVRFVVKHLPAVHVQAGRRATKDAMRQVEATIHRELAALAPTNENPEIPTSITTPIASSRR